MMKFRCLTIQAGVSLQELLSLPRIGEWRSDPGKGMTGQLPAGGNVLFTGTFPALHAAVTHQIRPLRGHPG
jgi:hypothetical protein